MDRPSIFNFQFPILATTARLLLGLAVTWLLVSPASLCAHDPGLSALSIHVERSSLSATVTLARVDAEALVRLDTNRDGRLALGEFTQASVELGSVAADALQIAFDGTNVEPSRVGVHHGVGDEIVFQLTFPRSAGTRLKVQSALLPGLPRGHRQYALVRDGQDRVLAETILDANHTSVEASLQDDPNAAAAPASFGQFLLLGVEHIVTGYDHLVFLLGLLIVGGSFRSSVKIITAFTVAHSVTLALATLDMIRLPASVVEPLIAASIMYVGVENIVRRDLSRRWILAFVFGLIHGCGFASVLRELGIGASGSAVAVPLLSFNLGVELGQVAIAALVLPLIWKLKQRASYEPRYVPAGSVLVSLAGGYWLVERLLPMVWR
jgi:YD repeat-containing protein